MVIKNVFTPSVVTEITDRINKLQPNSMPEWGKMNAGQMLAHLCITYEMVYEDKHPKPGALGKFFLKLFVKPMVVGNKPYKKNGPTAPAFVIQGDKNFNHEKERLIAYINKTQQLGAAHFEGKESHSFGKLTKTEWNTMFYKHLDHHLTQFGV